MFADNDEDAWESLKSWRGLRAPNRLQELDPMVLRETADSLDREELMSKFSRACLLYTSPSPRDNRTSRMPSSA